MRVSQHIFRRKAMDQNPMMSGLAEAQEKEDKIAICPRKPSV